MCGQISCLQVMKLQSNIQMIRMLLTTCLILHIHVSKYISNITFRTYYVATLDQNMAMLLCFFPRVTSPPDSPIQPGGPFQDKSSHWQVHHLLSSAHSSSSRRVHAQRTDGNATKTWMSYVRCQLIWLKQWLIKPCHKSHITSNRSYKTFPSGRLIICLPLFTQFFRHC